MLIFLYLTTVLYYLPILFIIGLCAFDIFRGIFNRWNFRPVNYPSILMSFLILFMIYLSVK